MLKRRLQSLPLVLVILAVVYLMPPLFVKDIDVTRQAIIYKTEDESSAMATTITVRGKLHKPWLDVPEFKGRIMIDELPFTKTYALNPLVVTDRKKGMNQSVLFYAKNSNGSILDGYYEAGGIQFDDTFSKMIIWVTAEDETYGVVAEAETLEEALLLRQRYESEDQ